MTDNEKRISIAEFCGTNNRFTIMKHGLYYRPNAHGYTSNIQEAWVVSEQEADKHVYPSDCDPVTKHKSPPPDYLNDLNACHDAEEKLPECNRCHFNARLFEIASGRNLNCAIEEPSWIWMTLHATARQRADALLKTIGVES